MATGQAGRLTGEGQATLHTFDDQAAVVTFGLLTTVESRSLAQEILLVDDPGRHAPDTPWAAVALRRNGSIAATCSMMLASGLFVAVAHSGKQIHVSSDSANLVRTLDSDTLLDRTFLHGFAMFSAASHATPFQGVTRIPPGETLKWIPGERALTLTQWCGPACAPEPKHEGDSLAAQYLETFDSVVADLAARTGPLVATISGGLDSTFVAASLAQVATSTRPVHGYCHSPLPDAGLAGQHSYAPDDLPVAQLMALHYPDVIHVHKMRNDALVHPLDAAQQRFRANGWPVVAVTNAVWLDDFNRQARAQGAQVQFVGSHGNATFSSSHEYAASYYLGRGRPDVAMTLAGRSMINGRTRRTMWPRRLPKPARSTEAPGRDRWAKIGVRASLQLPPRPSGRDAYLAWATGHLRAFSAATNPAAHFEVIQVDPFASRAIIELAIGISPRYWRRGDADRAFARRLGRGRVPEGIRTRRQRGGQGHDTWFVMQHNRGRLQEALSRFPSSGVLDDAIDPEVLHQATVQLSSRGLNDPPPRQFLTDILRVLSLIEYVDWVESGMPTTCST